MNYGYDAQGNRIGRGGGGNEEEVMEDDAETALVQAVDEHQPNGRQLNTVAPAHHPNHNSADDDDSSSSGSDFSDDVELVIGETGNQSVSEPLVESVSLALRGRHKNETEAFLQLGAGPSDPSTGGGGSGPALMIGERPGSPVRRESRAQSFLDTVARVPSRVGTLALAGSLHHGKTSLLGMLLGGDGNDGSCGGGSYAPRQDELDRQVSLKAHVTAAMVRGERLHQSARLATFVDTPGHADFIGEAVAGMRLADAVLFCVDAFESIDTHGERLLRHAVLTERLPVVLVITKVDRLLLDLKLPPLDAHRKLRMVVEAVNNVIASCGADSSRLLVAPDNGTVLFSSARLGFIFSLETFALKYAAVHTGGGGLDHAALAQRLWGQVTYEQGAFRKITNFRQRPSFVTFVMEPLYKIVAHSVVGKGNEALSSALKKLPRSPLTAMQEAVRLFLGRPDGDGMDAVLAVWPAIRPRTEVLCRGYGFLPAGETSAAAESMFGAVDAEDDESNSRSGGSKVAGVAVAAVAPLVCVFTGTGLISGSSAGKSHKQHRAAIVLRVLKGVMQPSTNTGKKGGGPSSSSSSSFVATDELSDDLNPFSELRIAKLFLHMPVKGFVEVERAYPGQVVYATLEDQQQQQQQRPTAAATGPEAARENTSTHLALIGGRAAAALLSIEAGSAPHEDVDEESAAYAAAADEWLRGVRPWRLNYGHDPIVHVSLELKDPAGLPAFQRGLEILRRTTPGLDLRTEESGEFTMTGFGELQLDTALHQLRTSLCPGMRIGLSQPFVSFAETVLDEGGALAVAGTRKKGVVGCTSGALPRPLVTAIDYDQIDFFPSTAAGGEAAAKLWTALHRDYGFDELDARNVMALGPDRTKGPSLLIDDTLEEECPQPLNVAQRGAVVAGFRDAMRSGPLVGETVRGVAVKLIFAEPATDKNVRANEVRASTRLAVRQSLFGARPRLLEPVLAAEVLCPPECVEKVTAILQQRRGAVLGEEPIAATALTRVRCLVPAMDSFGLETQIRMQTYGQAFPMFSFGQWDVVPGDPYDATVHVGPMDPAKGYQLARDFVLKTRFRKGLPQELTGDI